MFEKFKADVLNSVKKSIQEAFGEKEYDVNKVTDLQKETVKLNKEKESLRETIADLKLEHKQEKTEIEFLVKMKEEKQKLEAEKSKVAIEKKTSELEKKLQKEYFEETKKLLGKHQDKMQELTGSILSRLPDVNLAIKQSTKE